MIGPQRPLGERYGVRRDIEGFRQIAIEPQLESKKVECLHIRRMGVIRCFLYGDRPVDRRPRAFVSPLAFAASTQSPRACGLCARPSEEERSPWLANCVRGQSVPHRSDRRGSWRSQEDRENAQRQSWLDCSAQAGSAPDELPQSLGLYSPATSKASPRFCKEGTRSMWVAPRRRSLTCTVWTARASVLGGPPLPLSSSARSRMSEAAAASTESSPLDVAAESTLARARSSAFRTDPCRAAPARPILQDRARPECGVGDRTAARHRSPPGEP